jgi:hypothetical protein
VQPERDGIEKLRSTPVQRVGYLREAVASRARVHPTLSECHQQSGKIQPAPFSEKSALSFIFLVYFTAFWNNFLAQSCLGNS